MNIQPLQLARVSNLLTATMTSSQLTTVQKELLEVETQLSTGKLFSQPSDDPSAAAVTMQLQRTLDQRQTYLGNLASAKSTGPRGQHAGRSDDADPACANNRFFRRQLQHDARPAVGRCADY